MQEQKKLLTIDASLVKRLISTQFPHWASLPVQPVAFDGWDHRTFRLGEEMTVRLPSSQAYSQQVHKEQRWLPVPLKYGKPPWKQNGRRRPSGSTET